MPHIRTDTINTKTIYEDRFSNWAPTVTSLLIAVAVFSPVLTGNNFPLWSTDNLFGSYPALEISRKQLLAGDPSWFPYSCMGIDFSASIGNFIYSPILRLIMSPTTATTFIASGVLQFLCFWGVGVIQYYITRCIVKDPQCSIVASITYQISFSTLYYLQTFPNIILQLLFLLSILILLHSDNINKYLLIAMQASIFSTMLLTGHIVYSMYYIFANFAFFCYYVYNISGKRSDAVISYIFALAITVAISQYRLLPFANEVFNGSRLTQTFVYTSYIARPVSFFKLFIPELAGATIDKTNQLGVFAVDAKPLLSFFDMQNSQLSFLNTGIIATTLMLSGIQARISRFWSIASMTFLIEMCLPGLIGTLTNGIFFPFQHGAHSYLAPFFWSITAALSLEKLKTETQRTKFCNFLKSTLQVLIPIFYGVIINLIVFFSFAIYGTGSLTSLILKCLILVATIVVIIFMASNGQREGTVTNQTIQPLHNLQHIILTFVVVILSCIAFSFATETGRLAIGLLIISISIMGIWIPIKFKISAALDRQRYYILRIILVIAFLFILCIYTIPLLPKIGRIDYPLEGYFRLSNEYSRLKFWPLEWLFITAISLYRTHLALHWIFTLMTSFATKHRWTSVVGMLTAIIVAEQLPSFLEFTHYTSKPFVNVQYSELFRPIESKYRSDLLGYRINNVHKALPINTLFDYRPETEVLSNLPYAYGYNSYGGVNSQLPKRQKIFFDAYVESRTTKDAVIPNEPIDEIAVRTNFTDEQLLKLLCVKYNIEGQINNVDIQPRLLATLQRHNIVRFRTTYYAIPHNSGELDISRIILSEHPEIATANSLNNINCLLRERGEDVVCAPNSSEHPTLIVQEYHGTLSRFMLFTSYLVADDAKEAAVLVREGVLEPKTSVIVEKALPFIPRETIATPLPFTEKTFDNIRVEVTPRRDPAILLFNDSYNTGWQAFANGAKIEIFPANGIFMGALLPPGTNTVDLIFKPKWRAESHAVYLTGIILLLTLLAVGVYSAFGHRRSA